MSIFRYMLNSFTLAFPSEGTYRNAYVDSLLLRNHVVYNKVRKGIA